MSDTQGVCCTQPLKCFYPSRRQIVSQFESCMLGSGNMWLAQSHGRMVKLPPRGAGHGGERVKGLALQAIKHNEAWALHPCRG